MSDTFGDAKAWSERKKVKTNIDPETIQNLGRFKYKFFFLLTMVPPLDLKW